MLVKCYFRNCLETAPIPETSGKVLWLCPDHEGAVPSSSLPPSDTGAHIWVVSDFTAPLEKTGAKADATE